MHGRTSLKDYGPAAKYRHRRAWRQPAGVELAARAVVYAARIAEDISGGTIAAPARSLDTPIISQIAPCLP